MKPSDIEIGPDGQLLIAGLHDSSLIQLRFQGNQVDMLFSPCEGHSILVSVGFTTFLWSGGCLYPNVVSGLSIVNSPNQEKLQRFLTPSVAVAVVAEARLCGESNWALALEFSVGEPLIIFGRGESLLSLSI